MLINVIVKPHAKREGVFKEGDIYKVLVCAPPEKGKANKRVVELLAEYFSVSKSNVKIVKGRTSKTKVVEVILNH